MGFKPRPKIISAAQYKKHGIPIGYGWCKTCKGFTHQKDVGECSEGCCDKIQCAVCNRRNYVEYD